MEITVMIIFFIISTVSGYWDFGTTTHEYVGWDQWTIRASRFRWQQTNADIFQFFYPWWDWAELKFRRRLFCIAGITHGLINLSTAVILNRRTLITSANYLDPYMDRQSELRIWALGRKGDNNTPFRYRVWRVTRLFPRSLNPEHQHGPYGYHSPRHDIALIHSLDQIYISKYRSNNYHYAYRGSIPTSKHRSLLIYRDLWFAGSGFEYLRHIYENYKIFFAKTDVDYVVDCSQYLPKWWGKFICLLNHRNFPGLQNGSGLFSYIEIVGIGCFEIRYNENRILVFTDIRYYIDWIKKYAQIYPGEYYEYAYPQWSVSLGLIKDSRGNTPYVPQWQIMDDLYPLGKK